MKNLEDFLRPTQKQLFKRLCKKFKGKTLISKGNFILVNGQAPVMLIAHFDTVHEKPVSEMVADAAKPDFPKFVYVESFIKPYHSKKIRYYDDLATFYTEQDILPQKIPSEYQDIYEALLDFYSLKELESFRSEYGDQILWQINILWLDGRLV